MTRMSNRNLLILVITLFLAFVLIYSVGYIRNNSNAGSSAIENNVDKGSNESITIAAWNLQVFGESKAKNSSLLISYSSIIKKYDLVFVQEIRDENGSAFANLCSLLPEYDCITSSRAGRTSFKEEYGVIAKKDKVSIVQFIDFNPDPLNRWERPPLLVGIKGSHSNSSIVWIYVLHAKPSDTANELKKLEELVRSNNYNGLSWNLSNLVIIGDLNADCSFFDTNNKTVFLDWKWIIKDDEDTTTGKSNCAYDRILMNELAYSKYLGYGIDKNVTIEMSDHYLIWVNYSITEGY
jgi:deoxyribonuclease-1-like protein